MGLSLSLSKPVLASSEAPQTLKVHRLKISAEQRILWTGNTAEYKVRITQPDKLNINTVNLKYKIIDGHAECNENSSWSDDVEKRFRSIIFDWWRTKPNYLLFNKNTALKYLGMQICFKISKTTHNNNIYLDGYVGVEVVKWWNDFETTMSTCPQVHVWIDSSTILRGGKTILRWKISNIRNVTAARITARNHNYWFYDTSKTEPNIQKQNGNPYEVKSSYDSKTDTMFFSRTVVGHLAPRVHNLYIVQITGKANCVSAQDAISMEVIDYIGTDSKPTTVRK